MFHSLFDGADSEPVKICSICNKSLPVYMFGKDGGANYLRHECKPCAKKQAKILKEIKKTAPPIPYYHICPICNMNEEEIRKKYPNKKNVWCCDHDHNTNKFRGWVCHKCNLGLGNFNDSVKRLKNAINYLTKT